MYPSSEKTTQDTWKLDFKLRTFTCYRVNLQCGINSCSTTVCFALTSSPFSFCPLWRSWANKRWWRPQTWTRLWLSLQWMPAQPHGSHSPRRETQLECERRLLTHWSTLLPPVIVLQILSITIPNQTWVTEHYHSAQFYKSPTQAEYIDIIKPFFII